MLNDELMISDLLEKITVLTTTDVNKGKGIDEVAERQRRRNMMVLKEACERALWFTDSFNIDLLGIIFKPKTSNENITLNYNNPTSSSSITDTSSDTSSSSTSLNLRHNSARYYIYLIDLPYQISFITNFQW